MQILEEFDGIVDLMDDCFSEVTLISKDKEKFWATIPSEKLRSKGILNHRRFILRTIQFEDGKVDYELERIPDREINEEEISAKIDELLGDFPENDW